ncbi:MAG: transcriptional regulator [Alphaproteobacteria bacterium]|nr:MAG: transcriptional regulator [Alphaproteobacteria bacterium]
MPVIRRQDVKPMTGTSYPPPYDKGFGRYQAWPLSDAGGLTQFGAYVETLDAGATSSNRHWHENEDEFVYLLEGELVLVDDHGEHPMRPGDAAAFKAGDPNGHHLQNRSQQPATYLVVGTRAATDVCHYPDLDLLYTRDENGPRYTRADGSPLPGR